MWGGGEEFGVGYYWGRGGLRFGVGLGWWLRG